MENMNKLYVYDFSDGQYIVDESGERWEVVVLAGEAEDSGERCSVCQDPVTDFLKNQQGINQCWGCFDDVETIDLADYSGIFIDYGAGEWDMLGTMEDLAKLNMKGGESVEIMVDDKLHGYVITEGGEKLPEGIIVIQKPTPPTEQVIEVCETSRKVIE